MSRAWLEIDVDAIACNTRALLDHSKASQLCGVIKANGYGHDSVLAAQGALQGGASFLAVAQVEEGVRLRQAGIKAPIWLLGEPSAEEFDAVAEFFLEPTLSSDAGRIAARVAAKRSGRIMPVHVNADTGMHRSGQASNAALSFLQVLTDCPELHVASLWTHLAVGDEPDNPYTTIQLDRFDALLDHVKAAGLRPPIIHAANSGGTVGEPRSHYDVVRPGLSIYGIEPSPTMSGLIDLKPALRLVTRVSSVRRLNAGDRVGYGQLGVVNKPSTAATIPIGYADGIRRESWQREIEVLIGGQRRPLLGRVSMDQIVIDCGDQPVEQGDEVVLIGAQGANTITVEEVAAKLGTITNEVVCDLGIRLDRLPR